MLEGFTISGAPRQDDIYYGNINGDAYDDFVIVGANGRHYIVLGKANGFSDISINSDGSVASSNVDFTFLSSNSSSRAFVNMNGDAYDDFVLQANGKAYVYYGKASGFTDVDFTGTDFQIGNEGFEISNVTEGGGYTQFVDLGDVNNDGYRDLGIVEGRHGTPVQEVIAIILGRVSVIFGSANPTDLDLDNLGGNGIRVNYAANEYLSNSDEGSYGKGF